MDAPKGCGCGGGGKASAPQLPQLPQLPPQRNSYGQPAQGPPVDIIRSNGMRPPQQPCSGGQLPKEVSLPVEEEMSDRMRERLEKEAKEAELARWVSPLRQFDAFASSELRRRDIEEEDFPKLKVPTLKGHHRCRVSCLLNHSVDYAIEMEQELRNIGIQETQMMDMLEKLTRAEAAVRFQGAVRAAEVAAMSAPPELAEEAAVAGARGYTVETQEFSKSSKPGENPIEIIGYIGCTRPNNF